MAATLETLEQRLAALEREIGFLRRFLLLPEDQQQSIRRAEESLRLGQQSRQAMIAEFDKLMQKLGIKGEPVGAVKLQEMFAAAGMKPEECELSREIIRLREERG